MSSRLFLFTMCVALLSCQNDGDFDSLDKALVGFWSRETVYLNGVNSSEYVDFLNGGTNHLHLTKDKTFFRAYDMGLWRLSGQTITLDREDDFGFADWSYELIRLTNEELVIEMKATESQYCCGFDEFSDDEIITIREVYKRIN